MRLGPVLLAIPLLAACGGAPADPWSVVPVAQGATSSTPAPAPFRNAIGEIACPVMGVGITTPADAVSYADHQGVRYFMCCDSCEKLFLADPDAYANGRYIEAHDLDPHAPKTCD